MLLVTAVDRCSFRAVRHRKEATEPADEPGAVLAGESDGSGGLRYEGSVGTGWSERECAGLTRLLAVAEVDDCPFITVPVVPGARWVLPRLAGEVRHPHPGRTDENVLDGLWPARCWP